MKRIAIFLVLVGIFFPALAIASTQAASRYSNLASILQAIENLAESFSYSEPAQVVLSSCTPVCGGLVSHWAFDDGSGATAIDSSGNNIGTLINGPIWTQGKVGSGALEFTAANKTGVSVGAATSLNDLEAQSGSGMTISAWIYYTGGTNTVGDIVSKGGNNVVGGWYLRTDGYINGFDFSKSYSTQPLVVKARGLASNTWQLVTLTWDGTPNASGVHVYLNGNEAGYITQTNAAGTKNSDAALKFFAGTDQYGSNDFNGTIDDVRVYDRVLSPSEIVALYSIAGNTSSVSVPAIVSPSVSVNTASNVPSSTSNPSAAIVQASVQSDQSFGVTPTPGVLIPPDRMIDWGSNLSESIPDAGWPVCTTLSANAYGNGAEDATVAINKALADCPTGEVVLLSAGTFDIDNGINLWKSEALRGTLSSSGAWLTRIIYTGTGIAEQYGVTGSGIINIGNEGTVAYAATTVSGAVKGTTTITVGDTANMVPGMYLTLSENNPSIINLSTYQNQTQNCNYCGNSHPNTVMGQIDEIVGVSGNTVTLATPLYFTFLPSLSPYAIPEKFVTNAGIEDLYIHPLQHTTTPSYNVDISGCASCWVENIEDDTAAQEANVVLEGTYNDVVRDSYIHDAYDHTGGKGYGVWIFGWNSNDLIENNIIRRTRHGMIFEGGGSGVVFGYNYVINSIQSVVSDNYSSWDDMSLTGDSDTHGAWPYMNLYEGNVSEDIGFDDSHGGAGYNTAFRNYETTYEPIPSGGLANNGVVAANIEIYSYYPNIVGNILGTYPSCPGGTYENIAPAPLVTRGTVIYRLGFASPGGAEPEPVDPLVAGSILHSDNYDCVTQGIADSSGNTLPSSLYLSGKPSWWGNLSFPAIGPDLGTKVGMIPAEHRYLSIANLDLFPGDTDGGVNPPGVPIPSYVIPIPPVIPPIVPVVTPINLPVVVSTTSMISTVSSESSMSDHATYGSTTTSFPGQVANAASSAASAPGINASKGLTAAQIKAIIDLLVSFGADPSVISIVQAELTGSAVPSGVGGAMNTTSAASGSVTSGIFVRFTRTLKPGSIGADVQELQTFLNTHGFIVAPSGNGSPGHETIHYGPATARAVSLFQQANIPLILEPYGLTRGTGIFGPATMKVVNSFEPN